MNFNELRENKIVQSTVIIAVFSLLAKILGLVRDAVFSHQFGTSVIMDAYFAAFRVPDFIYNLLILGTFSVAFIPIFSEYLIKDKRQADRLASSILNMTVIMIAILTVLAYVFIKPLVSIIAPGFTGEVKELTFTFTKIFLLSPLIMTLSSIVSSILNSHKKFTVVAAAPVIYNLSMIFGAALYPKFGPVGLAISVIIGALLHFAVQLPQLFATGFKFSLNIDRSDPGFRKFWKLYWPRIFSMSSWQITVLIVSIYGSFLGTGALAAFYYSHNLQSVFLSIFAISFAIAVFPLLSDLFNEKNISAFKDVLAKTIIQILFFIVPLSIIMLVERAQVVRLVLGIGEGTQFTFDDTKLVAQSLGIFSISLFAQSLSPLFIRAFYAMHNTITPVLISFITVIFNIIITAYFAPKFGVLGLALSFTTTSVINLLILIMQLHHKLGNIHDEYLITNSLKIIIASLLGGAGAFVSLYTMSPIVDLHTYVGVLIQATVAALAGIMIYLGAGYLLGLSETRNLVKLLRTTAAKVGSIWS